jgi:hypothetical protein
MIKWFYDKNSKDILNILIKSYINKLYSICKSLKIKNCIMILIHWEDSNFIMIDFMCFVKRKINIEIKNIIYRKYKNIMFLLKWNLIVGMIG